MQKIEISSEKQKKIEFVLVALILFVGVFIRAYHFGIIPIGVHQDEAMAAVDAKALAEYGTDRYGMRYPVHFTAWGGSQMSVLLSYCMIPFIKLLGFSTVSIRLPMLVISSIGLLVLYFFAKQVGGAKLGVIALILTVISPWHYMQSRWSFDCNTFAHFFLFGTCLLMVGLKKRAWLYVSMVFYGLCCYCYGVANYSVPLFLLVVAIYLGRKKIVQLKEILICVTIYLLVALPEFLTMFLNVFKIESIETPIFTIPFFPRSFRGNDILLTNFSWKQLCQNIVWTITTVWGNQDKSITNVIAEFGPVYYISIPFFVIGLIVIIQNIRKEKEQEKKTPYFILLAWLFMGIWIGIVTVNVTIHRINIIFYPVIIIAGIGIGACIKKWKYAAVPIGGVYMVLALMFARTYFGAWSDASRIYYYEPYINALEYAQTIPCDEYYITSDPQGAGVSKAVGEILTLYSHEIDAPYYQGETNLQDGQEMLPFSERYHFQDVSAEIVDANKNESVVYIIKGSELYLFSEEEYEIDSFYDAYYVISAKQ